ncbi:MAG: hypothetical protein ACTSPI_01250 [Candidatus Heimdallarchaeaceae archaeon]
MVSVAYWNISLVLILSGLYLLLEHMYSYGRWDLLDILGHETFGILLLCMGLFISHMYFGVGVALITYILFSKKKWTEKVGPFRYAIYKLRSLKLNGGRK